MILKNQVAAKEKQLKLKAKALGRAQVEHGKRIAELYDELEVN